MKPIVDRTWQGEQSWYREVIEMLDGGLKVRYKIRVNAYDFQSYAKAEAWIGEKWEKVHTIPGQELNLDISYVERNVDPKRFNTTLTELRRVTRAVLG